MTKKELFDEVYRLTDSETSRKFDCGNLCGKKCCKNLSDGENASGMSLLPGEKEYLLSRSPVGFEFAKGKDGDILVCGGECVRHLRPFACRIFPYYADVSGGKITLKKDLRACSVCPLTALRARRRPNVFFAKNIKRAVRLLLSDSETAGDIIKTSDFVGGLYEFYSKLKI